MSAIWWACLVAVGESAVMLPIALGIGVALYLGASRAPALVWLLTFGAAFLVVAVAKLAFDIGGWSLPGLQIYSISGHAMLAGAVFPMLLMLGASLVRPSWGCWGAWGGVLLALMMAVGLVAGNYHTPAETVIGSTIGLGVAWFNLRQGKVVVHRRLGIAIAPVLLAVCLSVPAVLLGGSKPIKLALWHRASIWVDAPGHYKRFIEADPQTGRKRIRLVWVSH